MTAQSASLRSPPTRWLLAAAAIVLVLQLELVFNRPANWDEFYHLYQTHAFGRGQLTEALQVFYARAFFWVALLPLDAIDQLRVARLFMFACELFTTVAIFAMARRFTDLIPAAVAALAYVTTGYVFQHGFSYRADPMAAALLMGALWILLASRLDWRAILGAALLIALAVLTTIKGALYAPAFAGIAWLRWREAGAPREMLLRLAVLAGLAVLLSVLFAWLTILSIPETGHATASRTISKSASHIFSEGLFPRWNFLLIAALTGPVMALLVLTAPLEIIRSRPSVDRAVALVGLILPLVSVALYRNSFPYFYVFILAPVMVAAAVAARKLLDHVRPQYLAVILTLNAALVSMATPREVLADQRDILAAVDEIFPEPVAYFDFPGMIPHFPKANFFMTTWGMEQYRAGARETFVDAMQKTTVPLLIVNRDFLEYNQSGATSAADFRPDDASALREGFVPHWGLLWVAGHRFDPPIQATPFQVHAPGKYTLEGGPARIDGRDRSPGDSFELARGPHRFERVGAGKRVLRWGDKLPRPARTYSGGPAFKDF